MIVRTKFLLVEDDPHDVALVSMAFQDPSHELHVVCDDRHAIRYLSGTGIYSDRQQFPLPHVILLDLKMPRVNGLEFLKWLRHKSPGSLSLLPVVMISTSGEPADVKLTHDLGVNCFLTKPFSWNEFQERMKA